MVAQVWQQMLYYSYVTLSTLGYGDVLPMTSWARSLGSLVSVSGTLYLTIVVARLVGIWSSRAADDTGAQTPEETEPSGGSAQHDR